MHWFMGTVENAVQETIKHQSVMLVFISNAEPASNDLLKALEASPISKLSDNHNKLIAIRLEENTTAAAQFSAIYPVTFIPALYFVSHDGKLLDVAGREASDSATLLQKLKKAIPDYEKSATGPGSTNNVENSPTSSASTSVPTISPATSTTELLEVRVARARELIKQKQQQREKEQEQAELSKEEERRQGAKLLQDQQRQREDDEVKKLATERRREKFEQAQERQKILRQIAADRNDQLEKTGTAPAATNNPSTIPSSSTSQQQRPLYEPPAKTRILFRLPDSTTITQQFEPSAKLQAVSKFVAEQVQTTEFSMLTPMPMRHLDGPDFEDKTLRELDLYPTATIIVKIDTRADIQPNVAGSGLSHLAASPLALLAAVFYLVARLFVSIFDFLAGIFYREHWFAHRTQHFDGTRPEMVEGELVRPSVTRDEARPAQEARREDIDAQLRQRRQHRGSKKQGSNTAGTSSTGNIRRLADLTNQPKTRRGVGGVSGSSSGDDSDDAATYNGNSTQQL